MKRQGRVGDRAGCLAKNRPDRAAGPAALPRTPGGLLFPPLRRHVSRVFLAAPADAGNGGQALLEADKAAIARRPVISRAPGIFLGLDRPAAEHTRHQHCCHRNKNHAHGIDPFACRRNVATSGPVPASLRIVGAAATLRQWDRQRSTPPGSPRDPAEPGADTGHHEAPRRSKPLTDGGDARPRATAGIAERILDPAV
jgi:hypothetical protein